MFQKMSHCSFLIIRIKYRLILNYLFFQPTVDSDSRAGVLPKKTTREDNGGGQRRNEAMDKVKMGNFLMKLRNDRNLRQQDVADIFQVSPQAVSKWESGESIPDIGTLEKLSNFYKVGIDEIINGEVKNSNVTNEVGVQNLSGEGKTTGKPSYGPFIFSMSALLVSLALGFLPYLRFYLVTFNGTAVYAVSNFYETLFKVSSYVTVFAFLCALTFLAAALLSLGLWLSPNGKRGFWNASFWCSLANMVFALVQALILFGQRTGYGTGAMMLQPGSALYAVFAILYFVLFVSLPITRKKAFCPKEAKGAEAVSY